MSWTENHCYLFGIKKLKNLEILNNGNWCIICKAHLRFWRKFWEFYLMKYIIILWSHVIIFAFKCQAWITTADMKQKCKSKFFFECVSFRSIFFNFGFSLSEHCDCSTWSVGIALRMKYCLLQFKKVVGFIFNNFHIPSHSFIINGGKSLWKLLILYTCVSYSVSQRVAFGLWLYHNVFGIENARTFKRIAT
jgi:hypothetical protein